MQDMIRARDLADYIISKCCEDNEPINNLVLNHLLYSIQLNYISITNKFLFPEDIEAWGFGAVVPDVYYTHCGNGVMPLTMSLHNTSFYTSNLSSTTQNLINKTISSERKFKPWEFKNLLYNDNSVWAEAHRASTATYKEIITTDMMRREAEKRFFRV